MSCGAGTTTLTAGQSFFLRITQLAFTMSQALSLRKLADIMHGTTSLSQQPVWLLGEYYGADTDGFPESKLLDTESLEAMLADFRSRLWLTYRKDFPSIGPSMLTSDIGWGCTIRSGQMLVAEAIARIALGRGWSRQLSTLEEVQPVVKLFIDHPDALLSIHRICAAGVTAGIVPGRWVGPWMLCKSLEALFSPLGSERPMGLLLHVACGSGGGAPELNSTAIRLQMAAAAGSVPTARQEPPSSSRRCSGDAMSVGHSGHASSLPSPCCSQPRDGIAQQGVNAPVTGVVPLPAAGALDMDDHDRRSCNHPSQTESSGTDTSTDRDSRARQQAAEELPGDVAPGQRVAKVTHGSPGNAVAELKKGVTEGTTECDGPDVQPARRSASTCGLRESGDNCTKNFTLGAAGCRGTSAQGHPYGLCGGDAAAGPSGRSAASAPLLVLIPLTLGMDKINPVYLPQLQQILTWPQSVGIVGGRPSASLYLCGVQDSSFLYLDPHEAQPTVRWGIAGDAGRTHEAAKGGSAVALPASSLATYFCDTVRLMPATSLDPSMAIGFLCMGSADLEDLFTRLGALAKEHSLAPLMTLTSGVMPAGVGLEDDFEEPEVGGAQHAGQQQQKLEEWELV